jgi:hypothetical protein
MGAKHKVAAKERKERKRTGKKGDRGVECFNVGFLKHWPGKFETGGG